MSGQVRQVEERLSVEDVAERLKVSTDTVWAWRRRWEQSGGQDGLGPWEKLGRRIVRIRAGAVNGFLEARTI